MEPRFIILGGGPTGLGAAYRLKQLGYRNFHLYERANHLGGLASSFTDSAGFTWDIGGHVMFSHYKYYDDVFDELMGDEYQLNMRESWVRMHDRWVPYPFQNNIRYLPPEVCCECLIGLIEAQQRGDHASAANFEEFIERVFGEGICKHFMKPYNFKVWAHPPAMLNKQWIGERVAVLDVPRAVRNVVLGTDDFGWGPNNQFKFPLYGGTGEFYRRFAGPLLGHFTLNKHADRIDMTRKQVHFSDGQTAPYDILLSALPLDRLCNEVIDGQMPRPIRETAARLRHSGGHMVGIGLRQPCPSTKSWMYFPEDNCPFYRVTYLSNYSPNMTPDRQTHHSLLCETSYSKFKPVDRRTIVDQTIRGLINAGLLTERDQDDIVDTWHYEADYSYPTPSVERDAILAEVIPFLERHRIYSRGRFGMWKYEVSNTDHSMMQGVELVNRLLLDEPETTIGMVYESTDDGRNAAVHERSRMAGSGDPHRSSPPHARPGRTAAAALAHRATHAIGDREEADLAEEELGVTQPRSTRDLIR